MIHIVTLDLGATKCAAALVEYHTTTQKFRALRTCHVILAETSSLQDLIQQIEAKLQVRFCDADAVCIGAAGQYNGRELIHLSGVYPYAMPFAALAQIENWPPYAVLHDYDTVVCATFTNYMQDTQNLLPLNDCPPDPYQRRIALGLGTGLGLKDGVLLPNDDFWLGKNEMGHIGIIHPPKALSSRLQQHKECMNYFSSYQAKTNNQITFENVLTGRGLVHLFQFFYPQQPTPTPAAASEKMAAGAAPELLDLFAWYLGLFVGTVQLTFLPAGGIWITGGVVMKNLEIFRQASFTEGIQASPAYLHERSTYPMGVMINPEHALIGAGFYAVKRLLMPATCSLSSSLP